MKRLDNCLSPCIGGDSLLQTSCIYQQNRAVSNFHYQGYGVVWGYNGLYNFEPAHNRQVPLWYYSTLESFAFVAAIVRLAFPQLSLCWLIVMFAQKLSQFLIFGISSWILPTHCKIKCPSHHQVPNHRPGHLGSPGVSQRAQPASAFPPSRLGYGPGPPCWPSKPCTSVGKCWAPAKQEA